MFGTWPTIHQREFVSHLIKPANTMSESMDTNESTADAFLTNVDSSIDFAFRKVTTFPGDDVTSNVTGLTQSIRIGGGLKQEGDKVVASTVGTLNYKAPSYYWTENTGKRYFPCVGDQVLAIVEGTGGDFYSMNVFSGSNVIMNRLAFDGATKRNKPELKRGDIIYARVQAANPDSEAELSCTVLSGPKKEWSTGETVYGELKDGLFLRVTIGLARKLLQPDNVLLNALNNHFSFEVAIGMNGAVWLRAANNNVVEAIVIRNAILSADQTDDDAQVLAVVEQLVKASKLVGKSSNN